MKTFALLFASVCLSVALLDNCAEAAAPRPLFQAGPSLGSNLGMKMLNPQPLPPRYIGPSRRFNPGSKIGLNPQPLPPRYFKAF